MSIVSDARRARPGPHGQEGTQDERRDVHHPDADGTVMPRVCRACEARHRGICGTLTEEELVALSKVSERRTVKPGAPLMADGQPAGDFANVLEGVMTVSKTLADGRRQIVGLQFAPDLVGRPFEDSSPFSVEAATATALCVFPRHVMERMMRENPELERRVHRQALDQLDEARDWLVALGRKSAREKVASFLLHMARHVEPDAAEATRAAGTSGGEERSCRFDLPLTRSAMADFLGLTIESVSRQFSALKNEGVIELDGPRGVQVPSLKRLASVSSE